MSRAKTETLDEKIIECGSYYDILHGFANSMSRLDDKAADGEQIKGLQGKCLRLLPAFILLCGDTTREVKPLGRHKKDEPQNNLTVKNGWGMCPKCGKKCIKVQENTILVNYPMFCKVCRRDYGVTWRMPQ